MARPTFLVAIAKGGGGKGGGGRKDQELTPTSRPLQAWNRATPGWVGASFDNGEAGL